MAIAMLSAMSTDEIILALRTENLAKLTAIPGVGRKTAERLVIELRDKVMKMLAPETESAALSDAKEKQEVDLVFDDALVRPAKSRLPAAGRRKISEVGRKRRHRSHRTEIIAKKPAALGKVTIPKFQDSRDSIFSLTIMAKSERFEDLDVWHLAKEIANLIYDITLAGKFSHDYVLRDQVRRAAILIVSNIAEGFERDGNKEFIQFL